MVALVKLAAKNLPVPEILFFRQMAMLLFASPVLLRQFPTAFITQRPDLQLIRIAAAFFAMLLAFTAVVNLPLAEVTTIQFARNFFLTILAILMLGEVVGVRRWSAIIAGFVGVIVVSWPDSTSAVNIYGLMAIGSAAIVGFVTILVRKLSQVDTPVTIMCYQAIGVGVLMLPLTIYYWKTPSVMDLALIGAIGILSVLGQLCNICGLRAGEASAVAPIDYSRLIYAVALGYLMFDEWPEPRVFLGALIIVGAAIYTIHRERIRAHNSTQPTSKPADKEL